MEEYLRLPLVPVSGLLREKILKETYELLKNS
jgi:hypothetical protein